MTNLFDVKAYFVTHGAEDLYDVIVRFHGTKWFEHWLRQEGMTLSILLAIAKGDEGRRVQRTA